MTAEIAVRSLGEGPRVVMLHCDASTGAADWRKQEVLAERWQLIIPDRPGYGESPRVRVDFLVETEAHRPLLGDGAHLVGHSYGGVVALLLAAQNPDRVRSLTVIEPPAFGITEHPAVVRTRHELNALWTEELPTLEFYQRFSRAIGEREWPDRPLPAALEDGVASLMRERAPWHARPDFEALAAAPFPLLSISGGHHPAFEAVCDVIAERTGAERTILGGKRHMVPQAGSALNEVLEDFWHRS